MKSLEELAAIRDKMKQTVNTREAAHDSTRVVVGMATCGIAAGARPVLNAFTEEVARRDLHGVLVTQTGCIGICQLYGDQPPIWYEMYAAYTGNRYPTGTDADHYDRIQT